jgi:hypothetical protein
MKRLSSLLFGTAALCVAPMANAYWYSPYGCVMIDTNVNPNMAIAPSYQGGNMYNPTNQSRWGLCPLDADGYWSYVIIGGSYLSSCYYCAIASQYTAGQGCYPMSQAKCSFCTGLSYCPLTCFSANITASPWQSSLSLNWELQCVIAPGGSIQYYGVSNYLY